MKNGKTLLVLLALCMLLIVLPVTALAYSGSGTQADPYLIQNKADLKQLAADVNSGTHYKGKYFKVTADIDLGNEEWTPIGKSGATFQGHFDGGNKTISNLNITSGNDYVGLFGFTTNGSVKNLTVDNAKVKGRVGVGVVAGVPYTSKYSNIKVTGLVQVDGLGDVGGVLGYNVYANVTDITVDVEKGSYVNADSRENGNLYWSYVGGVIGFMGEGNITVSNVTSNIDVKGNVCGVGGITGMAHYNNKFINCSSSGTVIYAPADGVEEEDMVFVGGIAGVWHNQAGTTVTIDDCEFTGSIIAPEGCPIYNNGLVGSSYGKPGEGKGSMNLNGETVTDNRNVTYVPAAPVPTVPTYSAPQTGDNSQLLHWAGMMIVAVIGMVAFGKKRAATER